MVGSFTDTCYKFTAKSVGKNENRSTFGKISVTGFVIESYCLVTGPSYISFQFSRYSIQRMEFET